nr:hypothetical protein [uncultured Flavobacterium sp.]
MEIEITEIVKNVKVIDVELPYYYKHDLFAEYGESIIYGKIEATKETSIHESETPEGGKKYEIEIEEYDSIKNSGLASYFNPEFKSTVNEYEAAKQRVSLFLKLF